MTETIGPWLSFLPRYLECLRTTNDKSKRNDGGKLVLQLASY